MEVFSLGAERKIALRPARLSRIPVAKRGLKYHLGGGLPVWPKLSLIEKRGLEAGVLYPQVRGDDHDDSPTSINSENSAGGR